jgi:hypothetical protein
MKYKDDYKFDMFMETSAKTGFNAKFLFEVAAKLLFADFFKYKKDDKVNTILFYNRNH